MQYRGSRGRPKRRLMDVIKDNIEVAKAGEKDVSSRTRWKNCIRCGDQ